MIEIEENKIETGTYAELRVKHKAEVSALKEENRHLEDLIDDFVQRVKSLRLVNEENDQLKEEIELFKCHEEENKHLKEEIWGLKKKLAVAEEFVKTQED